MLWLLLPALEGVAVSDFAQFSPFCGRASAPADNARPLKQRELDGFRLFSIMHKLGIGNVQLQKWKSSSSSAACAELFLTSSEEVVTSWMSEAVDLFCCRTSFSCTNQPQRVFAAGASLVAKGNSDDLHTTVLGGGKNRVKEVLMQMGL